MSPAPIGSVAGAAQAAALVLQADSGGLSGVALGQILQAKVLQQLDTGRYLIRIAGQERVVESATPLRPDETLALRVGGSRERIELERVERERTAPAAQDATHAGDDLLAGLGGGRAAVVI